jgi:DivIVA domain-containing protein
MPFAPHEIEKRKFVVALRGYQTDEVEGFLRAVAADYAALEEKASSNRGPEHMVAEIERVMRSAREDAERDAAEIRAAAERDAAEIREATEREAEACLAEISRRAEELRSLEAALWQRMQAMERSIIEARHGLMSASERYPMLGTEPAGYLPEESTGFETNFALAIPAL